MVRKLHASIKVRFRFDNAEEVVVLTRTDLTADEGEISNLISYQPATQVRSLIIIKFQRTLLSHNNKIRLINVPKEKNYQI